MRTSVMKGIKGHLFLPVSGLSWYTQQSHKTQINDLHILAAINCTQISKVNEDANAILHNI